MERTREKPTLTTVDFNTPPHATIGDRRRSKTFLSSGRAIHQWNVVEMRLGFLFGAFLGTVVPLGALRAYGAVVGFKTRLGMLNEAAEAMFKFRPNTELRKETLRITKLCDCAAARRNEIAHGLVVEAQGISRNGCFLVPAFHSSQKRDLDDNEKYVYASSEIEAFRLKFALLATLIHLLENDVRDAMSAKRP